MPTATDVTPRLTQLRARGDAASLAEASSIEGELESARLEQLKDSDDPGDRLEAARLQEAEDVRQAVADSGLDAARIRPTGASEEGGPQLTAEDVRLAAERGIPDKPEPGAADLAAENERLRAQLAEASSRLSSSQAEQPAAPGNGDGPSFASDRAEQVARELGLSGPQLAAASPGSGADGSLTVDDVRKAAS